MNKKILIVVCFVLVALVAFVGCQSSENTKNNEINNENENIIDVEEPEIVIPEPVYDTQESNLNFREDGTFKIAQITDPHLAGGNDKEKAEDAKTIALVTEVLEIEKPDLVVITGDITYDEDYEMSLKSLIKPIEELGIPFAAVFGNHDDSEALITLMNESDFNLTLRGDPDISGVGNYYLEIKGFDDDDTSHVLYFLDSGRKNANEVVTGYDFIKRDQINWYAETADKLKEEIGEYTALAFFHIPIPEYEIVWRIKTCYGVRNEGICDPKQNSGLFSAMLEKADVKAIFVGHDHVNDFYGTLQGITMYYGRACGYNTYGLIGYPKGVRIIELVEDEETIESWMRLDDGTVVTLQEKHKAEF